MANDVHDDNPDAVLRPVLEDAGDEVMRRFAAWLVAGSGPDDWHRVLLGWNWDDRPEVLHWIVRQPQCDKATAC